MSDVVRDQKTGRVISGYVRKATPGTKARNVSVKVRRLLRAMFSGDHEEMKPYAVLAEIMGDKGSPPSDRIKAANSLADRIDGKAVQAVELSGPAGAPIETTSEVTHNVAPSELLLSFFKSVAVLDKHGGITFPDGVRPVDGDAPAGDGGGIGGA